MTAFSEDGDPFASLKQHVFPAISRRKRDGGTIRIWSIGCSTGEEPYGILIALDEYLTQRGTPDMPIQLFGTDVSTEAIEKSRAGVFADAAMHGMRADHRARFFTRVEGGGYRISKPVRERCAFKVHDIATGPPFSGLDLVCCRNLLGSFRPELRTQVLSKLRRALDDGGFLMLGRAESIIEGPSPFRLIDEENRIFAHAAAGRAHRVTAPGGAPEELLAANEELADSNEELESLNLEVQAAKEEIEANNEALSALNEALRARNKELDSVNADLVNVLGSVEVPIVIVDGERRIRRFTPTASAILNILPGDVGSRIDDLRPNLVVENLGGKIVQVIDAVTLHEEEVQNDDGRWYRLQIRPYLTVDKRSAGAVLSLVDIDILKQALGAAEERVQLLREAQLARASAEEANRTKDIFLATLSHELRTPLTTLLLSADLLSTGGLAEAQFRRTVDSIAQATLAQAQLVDDLFDISGILTGKLKMELRAVNLVACVQAAVDALAPAAASKNVELEVALDPAVPLVEGDPARLRQVVWNLLSNAFKFTPARGRVRLTLEPFDDGARIRVTDTGVGIDADYLPQLFDRFSQEDRGPTRAHRGLGLGLAIVRHIVEAHGGSVRADSIGKGGGATFTVVLPLKRR